MGDRAGEGGAHGNLGVAYYSLGDFNEYLARFRNSGDIDGNQKLLNYQAWTNKKSDRPSMKVLDNMTATFNQPDSQPASGSVTPASAKKSAGSPFV